MRQIHNLKCSPEYFKRVRDGIKPFEIRLNDRDYQVGDVLFLECYDKSRQVYTGEKFTVRVTYILSHFEGLAPGYVAMAVVPVEEVTE